MLKFVIFVTLICTVFCRYEANWTSLDSRPLPKWYDEGKIGIFIHWGVFSVPAFSNEWFWNSWKSGDYWVGKYMKENYRPDFTYADFGSMFHAEFYGPDDWAELFQESGASYIVLTTKHHEGFTNWPSKHSFSWNSQELGPKRDLVGDLAFSIRSKTNLKFGVYHSLLEWFHPLYMQDKANNFQTQEFPKTKSMPELYELVNTYKPDIVWSDGDWEVVSDYWNATEFLAWLYNDSPVKDTVVVNDRWGKETRCKHGGFWNCQDDYHPDKLVNHKWESCITMDKSSWGYRSNMNLQDVLTMDELISELAQTISLGGNILINVGPTASGHIVPIFEERLRQMGSWLKVNGEAIYNSNIWTYQNDTGKEDVWYTSRTDGPTPVVYAIVLEWPESSILTLEKPIVSKSTYITMLGYSGPISFTPIPSGGVVVNFPQIPFSQLPCQWGWVLKMEGLVNRRTDFSKINFINKAYPIPMKKKGK